MSALAILERWSSQGKCWFPVDVRPRIDANKINPDSINSINVASFSLNGFDATSIDPNTVGFGVIGRGCRVHFDYRDVDGGDDRDMVLRFQLPDTESNVAIFWLLLPAKLLTACRSFGSSPINSTVQE